MKIEVTKIRLIECAGTLCGVASILIDDALAVHDIRIIKKEKTYTVAMPSKCDNKGVYRNVVHPINEEMRQNLVEKVLVAFLLEKNK